MINIVDVVLWNTGFVKDFFASGYHVVYNT